MIMNGKSCLVPVVIQFESPWYPLFIQALQRNIQTRNLIPIQVYVYKRLCLCRLVILMSSQLMRRPIFPTTTFPVLSLVTNICDS